MSQPKWKFVANLGDRNPIEHGGYFIYVDETEVYDPEAELLIAPDEWEKQEWIVYRFNLEKCTYINGILSDNKYYKSSPAWFAAPESQRASRPQDTTYLKDLADFAGMTVDSLARLFCHPGVLHRAAAWRIVGDYHGFENLDLYPLKLNRKEVEERYKEDLKE